MGEEQKLVAVKPKQRGGEEKKRNNWPVVVLLAMTILVSLVFYLKAALKQGSGVKKSQFKIDFGWVRDFLGSETVTFEK